jgi:hypothetical protein
METGQETSEHIFMGGAPLNKFLSMKCIYNHCIMRGGGGHTCPSELYISRSVWKI